MFRSSWVHPQEGSCKHNFCMVYYSCIYVSSLAGGKGQTLPHARPLTSMHVNIPYQNCVITVFLKMNPRVSKYVEDVNI
jgi:hypothetical protein